MQLREYQNEYIYKPIVDTINHKLEFRSRPAFSVLGLSTSAGKTFTISNFCTEYCFGLGCDVVITSPNAASLEEIKNSIKDSPSMPYIMMANGFAGNISFTPPNTDRNVVLLCHPTYLSQNLESINNWSKSRKVVIFSDEAHKGFMCSGPEDTDLAFGYSISDYTAAWHSCLYGIDHVAWFLLSATPLRTTEEYDTFDTISEFFDRDVLCGQQAAVKNITLYGQSLRLIHFDSLFESEEIDNYTEAMQFVNFESTELKDYLQNLNDKWAREDEWLRVFYENHPDFPLAKPARVIQAKNTTHGNILYHSIRSNAAIAVDRYKLISDADYDFYLRKFDCNVTSQKIFDYIADKKNNTTKLVANKSVGEAVNIDNLSCLVSFHDRASIKSPKVTTAVEQVLGRMVRFPNVDGINNWNDVINFVETKITHGKVTRQEAYTWVDLVFKYDVHMVASENNLNGIAKYYAKQSYNPKEWDTYLESLIVEWQTSNKSKPKIQTGEKTPYAQKGSQSYKNYKYIVRECEYCSRLEVDNTHVPSCKIGVIKGDYTEEDYVKSLDVHHINGRQDTKSMNNVDNLMVVCRLAHTVLDSQVREKN